jgi:hypothetical protein
MKLQTVGVECHLLYLGRLDLLVVKVILMDTPEAGVLQDMTEAKAPKAILEVKAILVVKEKLVM